MCEVKCIHSSFLLFFAMLIFKVILFFLISYVKLFYDFYLGIAIRSRGIVTVFSRALFSRIVFLFWKVSSVMKFVL